MYNQVDECYNYFCILCLLILFLSCNINSNEAFCGTCSYTNGFQVSSRCLNKESFSVGQNYSVHNPTGIVYTQCLQTASRVWSHTGFMHIQLVVEGIINLVTKLLIVIKFISPLQFIQRDYRIALCLSVDQIYVTSCNWKMID